MAFSIVKIKALLSVLRTEIATYKMQVDKLQENILQLEEQYSALESENERLQDLLNKCEQEVSTSQKKLVTSTPCTAENKKPTRKKRKNKKNIENKEFVPVPVVVETKKLTDFKELLNKNHICIEPVTWVSGGLLISTKTIEDYRKLILLCEEEGYFYHTSSVSEPPQHYGRLKGLEAGVAVTDIAEELESKGCGPCRVTAMKTMKERHGSVPEPVYVIQSRSKKIFDIFEIYSKPNIHVENIIMEPRSLQCFQCQRYRYMKSSRN